jgi:hypothetical protein
VYLSSALRLKGGASIPAPVAKDIAAFALREKLTGRAFLKLSDENLAASVSPLQWPLVLTLTIAWESTNCGVKLYCPLLVLCERRFSKVVSGASDRQLMQSLRA